MFCAALLLRRSRAAFRRSDGVLDLHTLVQGSSPLYLLTGCAINSRGEITGWAKLALGRFTGISLSPNKRTEAESQDSNNRE
jgi:hypothetical protein